MKIYKFLSILLIIIFIFLLPTFIQKFVNITKIECKTQFGECKQQFQIGNYFVVKKQINEILSKDITVNSFSFKYKLPGIVKIETNIKQVKFAIKNSSNKFYLIDKDGLVIDIQPESPVLSLYFDNADYNLGDKVPENIFFSLKLIDKINWLYAIDTVSFDNDFIKVNLKQNKIVYLPIEGDIDLLSGSLRLIFSRLNDGTEGIRMEDVREIDLRYKNVVLR